MISNNFPFEAVFTAFMAVLIVVGIWDIAAIFGFLFARQRMRAFWRRIFNNHLSRRIFNIRGLRLSKNKVKQTARLIYRFHIIPLNIVAIAFLVFAYNDMFVKPLGVNFHTPEMNFVWLDQKEPFVIQFDRPINPATLNTELIISDFNHEIKGHWDLLDNGISAFKRRLVFTPEESFLPDRDLGIYISGISNLAQKDEPWDKLVDLRSPRIPTIEDTEPKNESKDLGIDQEVILKLDAEDGEHMLWDVKVTPETEFELLRTPGSREMRIKFAKTLAQGATYQIQFTKTPRMFNLETGETLISEEPIKDKTLKFTTVRGASIKGFKPVGDNVLTDTTIELEFDYEMDPLEVESKLVIEPKIEYTVLWQSPQKLLIKPAKPLEKDKTYTIKLPKGLKNKKGGVSEEEVVHSFKTVGKVQLSSNSPGNGSTGRSIGTNIVVSFNQEVDRASAQSKFSVNPSVAGAFSWNGNTMTFNPNANLNHQTRYTVKIAAGVKSVHGLNSDRDFTFAFTTEPKVFSLNVPSYRQPYRYACNITAAQMALAYRGVNVSVSYIHSQIGTASPQSYNSGTNTWGNPNAGFVGTLDGSGPAGPNGTGGYGVYWGPVRSFIGRYRSASVKSYASTSAMLRDVDAGNPVIIWAHNGFSGSGARLSWNSPSGNVSAVRGMHSYVVRGYIGSVDNPTSILVNDPGTRGRWTVSVGYFNSLFNTFGRVGVVVY
jgi:uncharacterized protein YvpB